MGTRQFDIILYGATGFTGRLTAQAIVDRGRLGGRELRWAIAGRDASRLAAVKSGLVLQPGESGPEVLVSSESTMRELAAKTRVVLSTAGPYAKFGEPLVKGCAEEGTDYCDLTGEPFWADAMVHRYEALAKEKKAIFCCMCGFDSIPADLGTHYVAKYVREKYGLPVSEVTGVFLGGGGFSGGTVASGINTMTTPAGVAAAADPLCLYPGHTVGVAPSPAELGVVSPLPDHVSPFWVPELNKYATYFPMAAINTRVVRRSEGILAASGNKLTGNKHALPPLKDAEKYNVAAASSSELSPAAAASIPFRYTPGPFGYSEYLGTSQWFRAHSVSAISAIIPTLVKVPGVLSVASRWLPAPGEGPSAEERAKSSFTYNLIARVPSAHVGSPLRTVIATVKGTDAGYTDTSKMLAEAGFALVYQRNELPGTALGGGFLTPATAFGSALVERLQKGVLKFEIAQDGCAPTASSTEDAKARL